MLDSVEVQGAELGPAGADHQCVGAFSGSVGGVAIANSSVDEVRFGFRDRDRIVGTNASPLGKQSLGESDGGRASDGICVRLKSQPENADVFILDRVERAGNLFDETIGELT